MSGYKVPLIQNYKPMKALHILCLTGLVLLTGCKNEEKLPESQTAVKNDTVVKQGTTATATASWPGKYSGVLPCGGDCKGIRTLIEVNADSTYVLSSQAIGRDAAPSTYKGKFHLDEKNIITLDAEGDHLKFQIEGGMLKKLDKFGDPEQGAEQARYLLHPVQ
jgi:uncharacterized lipoprotein NlpE involved in copper resistance